MRSSRPNAFTLVELLVVIAIIALLIALLLPALGQARIVTHSTVCQSNLHQVLLGIFSYAGDNNNYSPPWMFGTYPNGPIWTNPQAQFVKDYLGGSEAALNDPSTGPPYEFINGLSLQVNPRTSSPGPNQFTDWPRWPDTTGGGYSPGGGYFSYALSEEYATAVGEPSQDSPRAPLDRHIGDVATNPVMAGRPFTGRAPAESHLVYDGRVGPGGANYTEVTDTWPSTGGGQELKASRHMDGTVANVGYVDGHVAGFHNLVFFGGAFPPTIAH